MNKIEANLKREVKKIIRVAVPARVEHLLLEAVDFKRRKMGITWVQLLETMFREFLK